MITIPPGLKIFICTAPMDMRKSFDGMAGIARNHLNQDPSSGHIFMFLNKRGDKVKLFYWDSNGYCYWYKRLERGTFKLPRIQEKSFKVTPAELGLILEGIDLTDRNRLRAY